MGKENGEEVVKMLIAISIIVLANLFCMGLLTASLDRNSLTSFGWTIYCIVMGSMGGVSIFCGIIAGVVSRTP